METRTNIIYVIFKFTKRPKTLEIISKNIMTLQVTFMLVWMKQTLICFNLRRNGTGIGLSIIKDILVESLQAQMLVLQ